MVCAALVCGCGAGDDERPADRGILLGAPRVRVAAPRVEATVDQPTVVARAGRRAAGELERPGGLRDPGLAPQPLPVAWEREAFDVVGERFHRRVVTTTEVVGFGRLPDGLLVAGRGGGLFQIDAIGAPRPLRTPFERVDRLVAGPTGALGCAGDGPAFFSRDGGAWTRLDFGCRAASMDGARSVVLRADGALRLGRLPVGPARLVAPPVDGRAVAVAGASVVVVGDGEAAWSLDGARHFERVPLPGAVAVRDATFVGKSTVVAVGAAPLDEPSILVSRDAGRSWTLVERLPRGTDDLGAVAVNAVGLVVAVPRSAGGTVVVGQGAGPWAPLPVRAPVSGAALGLGEGFILGAARGLLRSVGVSGPPPLSLDGPLWDVAVTHPRGAGGAGVDGGLYRTTDGGTSWGRVPGTAGIPFWDVEPVGGHAVVAVGDGLFWRSEDAGGSWTQAPPPSSCRARWARLAGPLGLVGCEDGEVLVSNDGGRSWEVGERLPAPLFPAVWLDTGRAVASDGAALQLTEDGGRSWRPLAPPAPVVELAAGGDGVTLLTADGAVATTGDPRDGWRWVRGPAETVRAARAHRVLRGDVCALVGDAHLWIGAPGGPLRAVAPARGAHGFRVMGDGGLLVLGSSRTTRLEPR